MNRDDMENGDVENVGTALDGERTIPSVSARKRPPLAQIGIVVVVVLIAIALMTTALKGDRKAEIAAKREAEKSEREKNKPVGKALPPINFVALAQADPEPTPTAASSAAADPSGLDSGAPPLPGGAREAKPDREAQRLAREQEKAEKDARDAAAKRRESSPLAFSKSSASSVEQQAEKIAAKYGAKSGTATEEDNGLNLKLKPTKVQGARAGVLPDRNFMLTKGHFLDCTLEQAINSTLAGMLSCVLSGDVYSTNGKVVLMERGSRITGEYQRGLTKGQARLFVLWSRVETPTGVVVDLDSPGTDTLGRAGVDGYVNRHFFERFGGAILLSFIDDIGQFAVAKAQEGNSNQVNFGGTTEATQDMAAEALKHSIDIPPTLEKNQGGHVSIYVARDLDFSDVYTLASK